MTQPMTPVEDLATNLGRNLQYMRQRNGELAELLGVIRELQEAHRQIVQGLHEESVAVEAELPHLSVACVNASMELERSETKVGYDVPERPRRPIGDVPQA